MLGLNRKTIDRRYNIFCEKLIKASIKGMEIVLGEVDESCFGARRVRGKRGRGEVGKTHVFGLLKRNGNVFVSALKKVPKRGVNTYHKGICSRENYRPY